MAAEEHLFGAASPRRVPITLTHVQYDEGDMLGMVLAWFSLLPIFILVGFVTLITFRRDLHTCCFLAGIVANEGINFVLKHVIKAPRPSNTIYTHSLFVEYGMPSSHAQFMSCFATYLVLFFFIRAKLSYLWKGLLSCLVIAAMVMVFISRVYLGYHTYVQMLCGVVAGAVFALLWFAVVHLGLSPLFPHISSWKIAEHLLLRDMSLIPNVLWYEYTAIRMETRSRMRKAQ
ncbi:hypothetical protein EMCRGX_G020190 [Ephydatia muelleri]|eukprot:Em0016g123a